MSTSGLEAGLFACARVDGSRIIRDGRAAAPLRTNATCIDGGAVRALEPVAGAAMGSWGAPVRAADDIACSPVLAASDVPVVSGARMDQIADFMEEPD